MQPVITLTSDFGVRDSYVGCMKGVMLRICPHATLVDITHAIPPQDIVAATFVLQTFLAYFPRDTVHVVVVDPGVGTQRRPIALATPQARFVGPDNGLFGQVWQDARREGGASAARAVVLDCPDYWLPEVSATFHGRDIFSPVAAHLAGGVALEALGTPIDDVTPAPFNEPMWERSARLAGEVIYVDHFGNCITNITVQHLHRLLPKQELSLAVVGMMHAGQTRGMLTLPILRAYADAQPGEALALIGSSQRLEICIRNGNASSTLGIGPGSVVQIELRKAVEG